MGVNHLIKGNLQEIYFTLKRKEKDLAEEEARIKEELDETQSQVNKLKEKFRSLAEWHQKKASIGNEAQSRHHKIKTNQTIFIWLCIVLIPLALFGIWQSFFHFKNTFDQASLNAFEAQKKELLFKTDKIQPQLSSEETRNLEKMLTQFTITSQNRKEANDYIRALKKKSTKALELISQEKGDYYIFRNKEKMTHYGLIPPGDNTIFPGALFHGGSLFNESYNLVPTGNAPLTISSNIPHATPVTVSNVSYAAVQDAISKISSQFEGKDLKDFSFNMTEVRNSKDIDIFLGVSACIKGITAGVDFGTQIKKDKTNIMVRIKQTYYTINAEPHENSADYFPDGFELKNLGFYMPAYVSSVDYGRMAILMISSDLAKEELEAGIRAGLAGIKSAEGKVGFEYLNQKSSLNISIQMFGGTDNATISMVIPKKEPEKEPEKKTEEGFSLEQLANWVSSLVQPKEEKNTLEEKNTVTDPSDYLKALLDFIDEGNKKVLGNPVPIGYTLKYLGDNAPLPPLSILKETIIPSQNLMQLNFSLKDSICPNLDLTIIPSSPDAVIVNSPNITVRKGHSSNSQIQVLMPKRDSNSFSFTCTITIYRDDGSRIQGTEPLTIDTAHMKNTVKIPIDFLDLNPYDSKYLKPGNLQIQILENIQDMD